MTNRPAIITLNDTSLKLAGQVASAVDGTVHAYAPRCTPSEAVTMFDDVRKHIQALFTEATSIIAVMAAGAVIRVLSPLLSDKDNEPPVLVVSEDGASVVPLLGGHHGANALARRIAIALDAHAAVTTASDVRFGVSLDEPPQGFSLASGDAKHAMAAVLNGATVKRSPALTWAAPLDTQSGEGLVSLTLSNQRSCIAESSELLYHRRDHVLGVGCERGAEPQELRKHVRRVLDDADIADEAIAAVVSIDVKADEAAVHAVADMLGVPARFFPASVLEGERDRLANPSKIVFREVGCHGVAEGAALVGAGRDGTLVVPKTKSARTTVALAKADHVLDPERMGRARGHLAIVGIGPGSPEWRSPQATEAVRGATDLVGYSLYLDLLGPLAKDKTRHDYKLGAEEDRVRAALELAGEGRNVALVCSGDPGIYAMATLAFELLDKGDLSDTAKRVSLTVCPGISALQAAAARIGAPLGHDFCAISLSDLLTPWDAIQTRIEAVASGDFVVAFYNPVSMRRRHQLVEAKAILLRHRPLNTPVVLASNLGREGETVRIVPLDTLQVDDVDMLTTVIVGSSHTRVVRTGDGRDWVYTPRGYSAKEGTRIAAEAAE